MYGNSQFFNPIAKDILFFIKVIVTVGLAFLTSCNPNLKLNDSKDQVYRQEQKLHFSQFESSIEPGDDLSKFGVHTKVYNIAADIKTVWEAYSTAKVTDCWKGPLNKYQKAYSADTDSLTLIFDKQVPRIKLGSVYELRLHIGNLLNVPAELKITQLDNEKRILELTYAKSNRSHGKQTLQFQETKEGTEIIHTSRYKSKNHLRDKWFYCKFHEKFADELHVNMTAVILK